MNVIKNIRLLEAVATPEQIEKLEMGAALYQKHSRIEFKILSVEDVFITVRCVQSKSPAENYLSQSELIARTKDLFNQVIPYYTIQVHAIEYVGSPVDMVTPDWIQGKMLKNKVSLKTIVADTGIDKTSLSAVINGLKPLSQSMKGLFYYYFKNYRKLLTSKELEEFTLDELYSLNKTLTLEIEVLNEKLILSKTMPNFVSHNGDNMAINQEKMNRQNDLSNVILELKSRGENI